MGGEKGGYNRLIGSDEFRSAIPWRAARYSERHAPLLDIDIEHHSMRSPTCTHRKGLRAHDSVLTPRNSKNDRNTPDGAFQQAVVANQPSGHQLGSAHGAANINLLR